MPPKAKKASASSGAAGSGAEADSAPTLHVPACFSGKDFYAVLDVPKTATVEEISKAYKTLSLKHHPDRNTESTTATEEFQYLAKIHETLTKDPRRRAQYDKHGDVSAAENTEGFFDAYEYWREVFPELNVNDVDEFEKTYVGSADEEEDAISAWEECKGDFGVMMTSYLLFSSLESLPRHTELMKRLIAEKKVNMAYVDKFNKTLPTAAAKITKFEKEQAALKKVR